MVFLLCGYFNSENIDFDFAMTIKRLQYNNTIDESMFSFCCCETSLFKCHVIGISGKSVVEMNVFIDVYVCTYLDILVYKYITCVSEFRSVLFVFAFPFCKNSRPYQCPA